MELYRVRFQYKANNETDRLRIFHIIDNGTYGTIKRITRLHPYGMVYEVVIFTESADDKEELFPDLKAGGIFVIAFAVNDVPVFVHKNAKTIRKERMPREKRAGGI